jgi:exodeoxyribonuclease-3
MTPWIKVSSWNVNSLRVRLPHVLRFLTESEADVLCLQETKTEDGQFPAETFREAGWNVAFYGQRTYNGVAIISRWPLAEVSMGFGPLAEGADMAVQARYLSATVEAPAGAVRVASVYVPNGEALTSLKFAFKEAFYRRLALKVQAEMAVHPAFVMCGDFNVAADERDVPNPDKAAKGVLFTPQERQWLAELQNTTGLKDAFRIVSDEANVYSWWDYRTYGRYPQSGMRIDYAMVSPALQPHVQSVLHAAAERTLPQPSDHVPVTLVVARKEN